MLVGRSAFGLSFMGLPADIPLRPADAVRPPDVWFQPGRVPDGLSDAATSAPRFDLRPGAMLYRTRTIADVLVEHGRQVTFQPKPGCGEWELANLLLGAIAGGVMLQRGVPCLHGCVVDTRYGAVVICGPSGAGKSTLGMLLLRRGFPLLDDNVAPLASERDGWWVSPGTGLIRLTHESLVLLNLPAEGPAFRAPRIVKHLHRLADHEWVGRSRPLAAVYLLDRTATQLVRPLQTAQRLALLRAHWFMGSMAAGLGQSLRLFETTLAIARSIPMACLGQPIGQSCDEWADAIAEHLTSPTPDGPR